MRLPFVVRAEADHASNVCKECIARDSPYCDNDFGLDGKLACEDKDYDPAHVHNMQWSKAHERGKGMLVVMPNEPETLQGWDEVRS